MLKFTGISLKRSKVDTLAIPVCEDVDIHDDLAVQELLVTAGELEEFSGEKKQQVVLYDHPAAKVHRCLCMGIGPRDKLTPESLRAFAGRAVKAAIGAKRSRLVIAVPLARPLGMEIQVMVKAIMEGAFLGNHIFTTYKQKPKQTALKEIALRVPSRLAKRCQSMIRQVETICNGTLLAREWVSTPSNDKLPQEFAQRIVKAAKNAGLKTTVLDEIQLKKKKFGALMAVAVGSAHPPRLVEMRYEPKKAEKTLVLVGKGVTFDTGGINLKPSSGLNTMKIDMGGAAAVAATMISVAALKPKHRVIGVMPMVENMPSGTATRPGDIVTSLAGKTVEIGNTDAEGRLILIDAMAHAIKKYKPDILIDLATLTGACVVALGDKMAGVFSKDDQLAQAVVDSGQATHERCWAMPLPEDYKTLLKSELADISNMPSSRYGGAITAALFLSEFVGDTRWAHIDIAGPVFSKKASDYCGAEGTGFGVRLLCDLIEKI